MYQVKRLSTVLFLFALLSVVVFANGANYFVVRGEKNSYKFYKVSDSGEIEEAGATQLKKKRVVKVWGKNYSVSGVTVFGKAFTTLYEIEGNKRIFSVSYDIETVTQKLMKQEMEIPVLTPNRISQYGEQYYLFLTSKMLVVKSGKLSDTIPMDGVVKKAVSYGEKSVICYSRDKLWLFDLESGKLTSELDGDYFSMTSLMVDDGKVFVVDRKSDNKGVFLLELDEELEIKSETKLNYPREFVAVRAGRVIWRNSGKKEISIGDVGDIGKETTESTHRLQNIAYEGKSYLRLKIGELQGEMYILVGEVVYKIPSDKTSEPVKTEIKKGDLKYRAIFGR